MGKHFLFTDLLKEWFYPLYSGTLCGVYEEFNVNPM